MKPSHRNPLLAAVLFTLAAQSAYAASGNWNADASDNWSAATRWSSNPTVPGTVAGDVIGLTNNITGARTVTINTTSRTMGTLNIGDSNNTHAFTLASSGGGIMILNNGVSNAQINEFGTVADIISAPIRLDGSLTTSIAGTLTLSGGITESGSRSLTKTGAGTLVLNGTSSYSGTTSVTGGLLRFVTQASLYNNTEASWTAANLNAQSGATLAFNIGGPNQFTDANITTLLTNLAASSSLTNGMNAGSNFGFNTDNAPGGSFTLTGLIADSTGASGGARGLTKLGVGTLVLTNDNTYTGTTSIQGGTLQLSTPTPFTTASGLSMSGTATLVSDRATPGAGVTISFGNAIIGNGVQTFAAGSNVTSGTSIVQLASMTNDNGSVATPTLNPTTANLIITGGVNLGVTNTGTADFTLSGTGSVNSIGGAITNGMRTTANLIKSSTSTWSLSGASTYNGTTTINEGTLDLGGGTATGSLASPTLTLAGGTFAYTRTGTNTQSFTTTNINAGPAGSISVAAGNTLNLGTVTRGAGGWVDFSTTGAGIVAADTSNNVGGIMPGFSFGNTWAVANGANNAISGLSSYTLTSVATTLAGNYTGNNIDVNDNSGVLDGAITTNSLRFSTGGANTLALTGAPNVITSGGILVGSGVGANLSTISGGELTGAASSNLAVIQNNTLGGLTISSAIVNNTATGLTKSGNGLLTLTGANTYTGTTAVTAGTLQLSGAGTPGAAGSPVSVNSGALLDLNGTNQNIRPVAGTGVGTIANNSGSGTSVLTLSGAGSLGNVIAIKDSTTTPGGKVSLVIANNVNALSTLNTYTGGTTVNGGAYLYLTSASVAGGANAGAMTLTAAGTGASGNLGSGLVVDSATYASDISGLGYIHANSLTANNVTFTGNLTNSGPYIWRGGTVANNTFNFAGDGTTSVLNGVIGSTTSQVNGAVATGNVIKSGTGSLTLSGVSAYTGTTTVSGGKLTIASTGNINTTSSVSIGAGELNYNASTALSKNVSFTGTGGTLSGIGTITPSLDVTAGNTLAIGNTNVGTMNFSTNLTVGGTYLYELTGGGSAADLGDVAGTLTLGGILDLVQLGTYAVNDKFTLFAYDGTLTGLFKDAGGISSIFDDTEFTDAGGSWILNYNDTTAGLNGGVSTSNTYVTITAIPEPSTALLGALGMLALLRRRRN